MKFLCAGVVAFCVFGTNLGQNNRVNTVKSRAYVPDENYPPTPFEYSYSSEDAEGKHSAQQSGDGNGRVQGSYSMTLSDGRTRTVTYVADEDGYRAEVTTNELGTESKNPADVVFQSSAITGEQAAIQYGPQAPERQLGVSANTQPRRVNSAVALPSYGTFAGTQG